MHRFMNSHSKNAAMGLMLALTGCGAHRPSLPPDAQDLKCFYLDAKKIADGNLDPLSFSSDRGTIGLQSGGLFIDQYLACRWSRPGAHIILDEFSMDLGWKVLIPGHDGVVPILDPTCEKPFARLMNGCEAYNQYLTICGQVKGDQIKISLSSSTFQIPVKRLHQWTYYPPGNFPIVGDDCD